MSLIERAIYAVRERIERSYCRLSNSRFVATHYDKLAETRVSLIDLAAVLFWLQHFNNAP